MDDLTFEEIILLVTGIFERLANAEQALHEAELIDDEVEVARLQTICDQLNDEADRYAVAW